MKSGILLIDKDIGMTSREVDNKIGRIFKTHKVGHLGTLDPFASGLLIVALNGGSKFLPYISDDSKVYEATLSLGEKTSTGDLDGEIIERKDVPPLSEEKVKEALLSFLGESLQLPPMYSAIKINGTPLYKLAHKAEEIERKKRLINVYSLELLSMKDKEISFKAKVSAGTYIRTLGEDIALSLGTVGHLTSLRRTSIGSISVKEAIHLAEVSEPMVKEPTPFLSSYEHIEVEAKDVKAIKDGRVIDMKRDCGSKIILTYEGIALAVYAKKEGSVYKAERGLFL